LAPPTGGCLRSLQSPPREGTPPRSTHSAILSAKGSVGLFHIRRHAGKPNWELLSTVTPRQFTKRRFRFRPLTATLELEGFSCQAGIRWASRRQLSRQRPLFHFLPEPFEFSPADWSARHHPAPFYHVGLVSEVPQPLRWFGTEGPNMTPMKAPLFGVHTHSLYSPPQASVHVCDIATLALRWRPRHHYCFAPGHA
jgi:hypothetical protein